MAIAADEHLAPDVLDQRKKSPPQCVSPIDNGMGEVAEKLALERSRLGDLTPGGRGFIGAG
jgi:hypothetical protein